MLPPVESGPEPVVRWLEFADGATVVITSFEGMTTVNWSASAGLATFLEAVESTVGVGPSPEVAMQRVGEHEVVEYQPSGSRPSRWLPDTESSFQLFRIDVSTTRSVAWQRLDSTSVVVGLGDASGQLALAADPLGKFIETTAMGTVDLDLTMSAIRDAVGHAGHGDDHGLNGV